jgi:enamine deaminase RidA (YjgF/YER057c/UK114 family)
MTPDTHHTIFHADPSLQAANQFSSVLNAIVEETKSTHRKPVFARFFLSDIANQQELLQRGPLPDCPLSVIEQAPLDGSKVAALVFFEEERTEPSELHHIFTGNVAHVATSQVATEAILRTYATEFSLSRECVRTWFFVNDIDNNYAGMVLGRNNVFDAEGLTVKTHFIASTGIAGRSLDPHAPVTFNAYAIRGLQERQVTYLKAASHMNPTAEYGVAFERGTAIDFADRRLVLISGTASIDNRGNIVHCGDVIAQTARMLENVETLLAEADCATADMMHAIVYLRDPADYRVVESIISRRLEGVPYVIVHAPVCRPGWLIEMECMALKPISRPGLPAF